MSRLRPGSGRSKTPICLQIGVFLCLSTLLLLIAHRQEQCSYFVLLPVMALKPAAELNDQAWGLAACMRKPEAFTKKREQLVLFCAVATMGRGLYRASYPAYVLGVGRQSGGQSCSSLLTYGRASCLRHCAGLRPTLRLNAALNAAAEL